MQKAYKYRQMENVRIFSHSNSILGLHRRRKRQQPWKISTHSPLTGSNKILRKCFKILMKLVPGCRYMLYVRNELERNEIQLKMISKELRV